MDVSKISMPLAVEPVVSSRPRPSAPQPAPDGPQAAGQAPPAVSPQELEETLSALAVHYNLRFELSHDEKTGSDVVRIFSQDGERLLRQMPPEAVLKIAEDLDQGGNGGLLASLV
ncbi:MAG: flagellar protein FlaG [Desulfarculus sp.]|nr:flagellar protein FlaG [Desulfarculus sp.]